MAAGTASVPSRTEAAAPSLLGLQPGNLGPHPHTCTDRNISDAQLWFPHHIMHDAFEPGMHFCMTLAASKTPNIMRQNHICVLHVIHDCDVICTYFIVAALHH